MDDVVKNKLGKTKRSKKIKEIKSQIQLIHDILSLNQMKNILDLICLYHEINQKVIKAG